MRQMLILQATIFTLVAVGLLIRRLGIVGPQARKDLTNLVLYVVLPCNIVTSFLTDISGELLHDCLTAFLISVGIQLAAVFYGPLFFRRQPDGHRRNIYYAFICSNAAFLGYPVAEGVFGAAGLMLASVYLIPQRIMMWSRGLAIFTGVSDRKSTVRRLVTHPCIIACVIGIVLMLTGIDLPEVLLNPIRTIGRCTTALSMMVVGMILAEVKDIRSLLDRTIARFTLHRLVIFPLLIYIVLRILPVSATARGVSVLLAAMPAGANTSMMASKYEQDPQFAVRLVVFSTICSIPAIIAWSWFLTLGL